MDSPELVDPIGAARHAASEWPFLRLRGIASYIFQSLGGGAKSSFERNESSFIVKTAPLRSLRSR